MEFEKVTFIGKQKYISFHRDPQFTKIIACLSNVCVKESI